jgi:hypothetical protein
MKESHLFQKDENPAQCLPVGIELVFEQNTSCNLGFSLWRWLALLQIGQLR